MPPSFRAVIPGLTYKQVASTPESSDDKIKKLTQWSPAGIGNVKRGQIVELLFPFEYSAETKFLDALVEAVTQQLEDLFDLPHFCILLLKDSTTPRNGWRDSAKVIRTVGELRKR